MVNEKLVDYFLEGVGKGYSVEVLSDNLIKAGWSEDAINKAAMTIPDDESRVGCEE